MPKHNGIGYSRYTKPKIDNLTKILEMHMSITQAVINKYHYYQTEYRYIDLTSGQGFTPNGISGSPVVFLSLAERKKLVASYKADFIEREQDSISSLKATINEYKVNEGWTCENVNYHFARYQEKIPELLPNANKNELGLVFVDHTGDPPDINTLNYISTMRPRMEILLYIPAANIKRVKYLTNRTLADFINEIGKEFWLIRKPIKGDPKQWTFLLGSSCNIFDNYKKIDFLRLDSEDAQKFFPILNLTEKEREEQLQPKLPFF